MNTDSSSPDEVARRDFLSLIELQLHTTGMDWTSEYRKISPSGSYGLVITAPGVVSEAYLVAIALYDSSARDAIAFPAQEALRYQLLFKHQKNDYLNEYLISPDPPAIISTLQAWAASQQKVPGQILSVVTDDDLAPLRALATAQKSIQERMQIALAQGMERCSQAMWQTLGLVRDRILLSSDEGFTTASRALLEADLRFLAADLITMHFPRENDGRLALNTTVLLATYDYQGAQSRGRQMWLVAHSPKRRRDPQVVTLSLASLISDNHPHRWDQARWLWDIREQAASEGVRWGVAELPLERLNLEQRADHLPFFAKRCAQSHPSLADRVALCLLLQDEGRIEEAFSLFGVELTPAVLSLLERSSAFPFQQNKGTQATMVLDALRHMAPWRFASILKRGTRFRLFGLPHQTQQRKASLFLMRTQTLEPKPCLEIAWTASNKRLAEIDWRRPLDMDLKRWHV